MVTEREKEKELVQLLHAARKAAGAAELEAEGETEESRCLDALAHLRNFPVTVQLLVSTQVGKHLRPLTKHSRKNIQNLASDVFSLWKKMVLEQTNGDKKNGTPDDKTSIRAKPVHRENVKTEKVQKTVFLKVDHESVKLEEINQDGSPTSAKSEVSDGKMKSIPTCNDPLRDKIRELLHQALCKVLGEAEKENQDKVKARDAIQVAVSVESVLFKNWGRSDGSNRIKYRSLVFNMKDANNPDFRRKVLMGEVKPERIVGLSSEEMASDARQKKNKELEKKALLGCQLGSAPKATTDAFKCGRCGQRKTTYYQMQTRSADEPMTTYVTCVNCNNHWKMN